MKKQEGFTLIELIVVMVILGILSTIAIPIYIDLRTQAAQANVNGVAGAISSASSINYGAKLAGSTSTVAVTGCNTTSAGLLIAGGMPAAPSGGAYTITAGTGGVTSGLAAGVSSNCVLTLTGSSSTPVTANFTVIGN